MRTSDFSKHHLFFFASPRMIQYWRPVSHKNRKFDRNMMMNQLDWGIYIYRPMIYPIFWQIMANPHSSRHVARRSGSENHHGWFPQSSIEKISPPPPAPPNTTSRATPSPLRNVPSYALNGCDKAGMIGGQIFICMVPNPETLRNGSTGYNHIPCHSG